MLVGKSIIDYQLLNTPGFLKSINVGHFFFQKNIFLNLDSKIRIKNNHIDSAKLWLYKNIINYNNYDLVFIHIRLGDYKFWPREGPAILPDIWYENAVNKMNSLLENPFYIIISDEPNIASKIILPTKNSIISRNDIYTDLSLMTLCNNGILSASTISFWGMKLKILNDDLKYHYFAPKYWYGYNQKKHLPEEFSLNNITFLE